MPPLLIPWHIAIEFDAHAINTRPYLAEANCLDLKLIDKESSVYWRILNLDYAHALNLHYWYLESALNGDHAVNQVGLPSTLVVLGYQNYYQPIKFYSLETLMTQGLI